MASSSWQDSFHIQLRYLTRAISVAAGLPHEENFLDPGAEVFIRNGRFDSLAQFVGDHTAPTSIDQLLAAVAGGPSPDSDVATAADGVEVLCAAYLSALEDRIVDLPLAEPRNRLFK